jgi:hypothetical protein
MQRLEIPDVALQKARNVLGSVPTLLILPEPPGLAGLEGVETTLEKYDPLLRPRLRMAVLAKIIPLQNSNRNIIAHD